MAKYVTLLMDVEDPFRLYADDAALEIAQMLNEEGIRSTQCVTGENCRKFLERGRSDVIEALSQHALGLHTDTHSFHPTTMELLEDKGWEDGLAAVRTTEGRGLEAFEKAFGRKPVCWGGAGNTWGPQITGVLPELGIPSFVYAHIATPDRQPFKYIGVVGFPGGTGLGEPAMESRETASAATDRVIDWAKDVASPWAEIFIGHPTRYHSEAFWDADFANGQTPESYVGVPARTREQFRASLENLRRSVVRIAREFTVLGLDDVLSLPWTYRKPSPAELESIASDTARNVRGSAGWPIHKPNLDTANIERETLDRLGTLLLAELS